MLLLPIVSVVIPTHNAVARTPEAPNSVLSQIFTGFEAIIIDDSSKDNIVE